MKRNIFRDNTGFTMIELLVVIAILGVLASMTAVNVRISLIKSRDAERKSDLGTIQKALELYQNDHGTYPAGESGGIANITWGQPFIDSKGTVYVNELPADPRTIPAYCYRTNSTSTAYQLYANLENTKDSSCIKASCDTVICNLNNYNYGVSSTNISPLDDLD